jgi:DNA-binding response OmpR family regulator
VARILVIDDEEVIRIQLRLVLEDAGHEVDEAEDGEAGCRLFRERPADLIITDMIMPKKDGANTILDLWRDFPHVRIIAISGGDGTSAPEEFLEYAGAFGALRTFAKPVGRDELLAAVDELVARKPPQ